MRKFGLVVVTPTATGLQLHEHRIVFPSGSQTAFFCPAHFQGCNFEQLASSPSSTVHMGSQAGKAYRIVLEEHGACYSVLALLLAFVSPSRKRKEDKSPSDKLRRLSSPRCLSTVPGGFRATDLTPRHKEGRRQLLRTGSAWTRVRCLTTLSRVAFDCLSKSIRSLGRSIRRERGRCLHVCTVSPNSAGRQLRLSPCSCALKSSVACGRIARHFKSRQKRKALFPATPEK